MKNLTTKDISIELALAKIKEAMGKDPDYKQTYITNMSMSFLDEYRKHRNTDNNINVPVYIDYVIVHRIANNASINFLKIWLDV